MWIYYDIYIVLLPPNSKKYFPSFPSCPYIYIRIYIYIYIYYYWKWMYLFHLFGAKDPTSWTFGPKFLRMCCFAVGSTRPGKHTKIHGKSLTLMAKSTISITIFNSYVKLPEGWAEQHGQCKKTHWKHQPPVRRRTANSTSVMGSRRSCTPRRGWTPSPTCLDTTKWGFRGARIYWFYLILLL